MSAEDDFKDRMNEPFAAGSSGRSFENKLMEPIPPNSAKARRFQVAQQRIAAQAAGATPQEAAERYPWPD